MWQDSQPAVTLATFADAAAGAEVVVNATSGGASLAALTEAGADNLAGKLLVDVANPLDFSRGMPPTWTPSTPTASASRSSARSRPPGWSRP